MKTQDDEPKPGRGPQSRSHELRWLALRLAAETAPRLANGVRPEDIVARAKIFEVYLSGVPSGSADVSIVATGSDVADPLPA